METSLLRLTMGNRKFIVLLCIAVLLPLLPLLFGSVPATGDMRDVYIPLESFFRSSQLQGDIPAWNGAVSFGFPVIAAAQIGFFYPVLFVLRFLPIWLELPSALIAHALFMAVGTFLFARRLGMSREASFISAVSFPLSQFVWQHVTHLNIFLAVSWFPWQMLAIDVLFRKEKLRMHGIGILIVLFGLPFLIGQIQVPFLIMAVALVYGIYLKMNRGISEHVRNLLVPFLLICVGSFLFASVQLLPTLELTMLSSRGASESFDITRANQHSYPFYHLPTYVFPKFYGNDDTYWGKRLEIEYGSYIGVIPLILALWYAWKHRTFNDSNSASAFFFWMAIGSFLLALGSLSPFRLIGIEPSLWIFSAPARWLLFTTFSLAICAGFGFDMIWKDALPTKKLFFRIALIGIVVVGIGNLVLAYSAQLISYISTLYDFSPTALAKLASMASSATSSSISLASSFTYLPILLLLALSYALTHRHGKNFILILIVLDLALIAGTTTPMVSWNTVLSPPTTIQELPESVLRHDTRVYALHSGGDTGAYFTNPESRANETIRELQKNLLVPMQSATFGIYGSQWPASLDLSDQGAVLEQLYPTPAGTVKDTALAKELSIGAVLSATKTGGVHIETIDAKPRIEILHGSVQILAESPSKLVMQTNASEDTTLIVRDTFYPGWRAYVDEQVVPIEKSPLFFRSVAIPAGKHIFRMQYVPTMLYVGGAFSLFMLTLLICIAKLRPNTKSAIIEP